MYLEKNVINLALSINVLKSQNGLQTGAGYLYFPPNLVPKKLKSSGQNKSHLFLPYLFLTGSICSALVCLKPSGLATHSLSQVLRRPGLGTKQLILTVKNLVPSKRLQEWRQRNPPPQLKANNKAKQARFWSTQD